MTVSASAIKNVYFVKPVGLDGPIKIGCSHQPAVRVMDLAVWSPFPLELIGSVPGTYDDEQFFHACFADAHSHREWFRSSPALRAAIETVLAAGSVEALRASHSPTGSIKGRRKRTPEECLKLSYSLRVIWAQKKLRRVDEAGAWHAPKDVESIMYRWCSYRRPGKTPRPAEFARLDEYLANPAAHSIVPEWCKPHLIELIAHSERLAS